MRNLLKKFWRIELDFKSPLHIGKGSIDTFMGAAQVVTNGKGEYVIPGTSLAGSFLSTMKLVAQVKNKDDNDLWNKIVKGCYNSDNAASPLVFRTVSIDPEYVLMRDKVRINRKTKTADEGAKFSQWEVLPKNAVTILELDNLSNRISLNDKELEELTQWVEAVISSWKKEGFFIGGHRGTGNGYAKIKECKYAELNKDNLQTYLNSSIVKLPDDDMGWLDFIETDYTSICERRYFIRLSVDLQNPLLIKGGVLYTSVVNPDTDAPFIHKNGTPFIPGSSLRGALSAFMDKHKKENWRILLGQDKKCGGSLIFTDLLTTQQGEQILINRHAEDQFSRAIWGSGKFDEERLFKAEFTGEILCLRNNHVQYNELDKLIAFLNQAFEFNLIGLGSGACYPTIRLERQS